MDNYIPERDTLIVEAPKKSYDPPLKLYTAITESFGSAAVMMGLDWEQALDRAEQQRSDYYYKTGEDARTFLVQRGDNKLRQIVKTSDGFEIL